MSPATLAFALAHRDEDVRALALRRTPDDVDLTAALQQIAGWQIARRKLPSWAACDEILYPVRLSMEQCSSQAAAEYKRQLVSGLPCFQRESPSTFTDLTGGLGVDFSFLAPLFSEATYVERNAELCAIARHNIEALGHDYVLNVCNKEAEEVLCSLPRQSLIYLDPARRDVAGRKVFMTADCQPDVVRLHDALLRMADVVMVKLSPMLDIHDAIRSLPSVRQVHVVEVDGEVKELLLLLAGKELAIAGLAANGPVPIVCARLQGGSLYSRFTFTFEGEEQAGVQYADTVEDYLYEPSPAIMKAGAFRTVAARYGLKKLHPDSHLYTSTCRADDFPGRVMQVLSVAAMREAKSMLAGVTHANVVTRNFPMRPDELKRRLRLKDGGRHFLYATTVASARLLVLCQP